MGDLLVEVQENPSGELGGPPIIAKQEFGDNAARLASSVGEVTQNFSQAFEELNVEPPGAWQVGEVEVKFGLSLEASGNVLVVKGTAGANFSARILWRRAP